MSGEDIEIPQILGKSAGGLLNDIFFVSHFEPPPPLKKWKESTQTNKQGSSNFYIQSSLFPH